MFTTGSKFFIGASALALIGAIVYPAVTDGPASTTGTIGLVSAFVVLAFLAGVNVFNRDGNLPAAQEGALTDSAAAQGPVGRSAWPLVTAVGLAGLVVGVVSKPVVFKVAVVVLLAGIVEWMVQGWSERASADRAFNGNVRRRLLYPLEFPLLGAALIAVVAYPFSRVLLGLDKEATLVVFGVVGALVLAGGFLFASKRDVSKRTILGVCAVAGVALMGVGVASAVQGQKTIERHVSQADEPAVCLEAGVNDEIDGDASQDVSAKSSVIANIYLQNNGTVIAYVNGFPDQPKSEVTIPRGADVSFVFHNDYESSQRLTARLGTFGDNPELVTCTTAVHSGKSAFIRFRAPKSNLASSTPLVLSVPGLEGQEIALIVP